MCSVVDFDGTLEDSKDRSAAKWIFLEIFFPLLRALSFLMIIVIDLCNYDWNLYKQVCSSFQYLYLLSQYLILEFSVLYATSTSISVLRNVSW